jgi:hypothetical protein
MSSKFIYRAVTVLLLLFALGHTLGFNQVDPRWGVSAAITALQTIRFTAQGTPGRTYWGFYLGFGYFCSTLMFFAAVVAWQLSRLPGEILRRLQVISWAFALAFVAATIVTWKFFFTAPMIFTPVITLGLIAGAWRARTA